MVDEDEVRVNLRGKVFKDTRDIISKICSSVNVDTDKILDVAVADGLFTFSDTDRLTGSWTCLPPGPIDETVLYDPFRTVANLVVAEVTNNSGVHGKHNGLGVHWESNANRLPLPNEENSTNMKLDVAGLWRGSAGLPVYPRAIPPKASANPIYPWHEIIAIVEMKKKSVMHEPALKKLLEFFFQLFGETVDRRGIWGLVLSRGNLTVWLADRSGVIGSKPVDIHLNPHLFIRILAAFTVLEPHCLGIDTHVELFREPTYSNPEALSDPRGRPPGYVPSAGLWKVIIDSEAFILWKAVSLQRAHTICGRATRVWHAWLEVDFLTKWSAEREHFIVKDSWRDSTRAGEGFFYNKVNDRDTDGHIVRRDGVALFRRACIAQVGGVADTTDVFRCGVEKRGASVLLDARQDVAASVRDPKITAACKKNVDNLPHDVNSPDRLVRGRTHDWVVLKTYGWPMTNAVSPLELATILRDAIAGHKDCWEKKVLHRDISPGNILIVHVEDEDSDMKATTYRGALIDFDNAKYMQDATCLYDDEVSITFPYCSGEVLGKSRYFAGIGSPKPGNHAIHDLESFMWCLIWMCIYRGEATSKPRSVIEERLRSLSENLFDGHQSTLIVTKRSYIQDKDRFRRNILPAVKEYWAALRPLCERFYLVIRGEYRSGAAWTAAIGDTSVHDRIIDIFDDAIRTLAAESDGDDRYKDFQTRQLAWRMRDWLDILEVPGDEATVRTKRMRDLGDDNPATKRAKHGIVEEAQHVGSDETGSSGY